MESGGQDVNLIFGIPSVWNQIATEGPSGRGYHVMAYDTKRRRLVLFGGLAGSIRYGDTWEIDMDSFLAGASSSWIWIPAMKFSKCVLV